MPAEDISFLCRWHWLPIFLGLGALVRKQPSAVWTPVTLELISLPISCSIWVMANLLCVSGERCLLCYFFALWLANYFLLKLGQPIAFFAPFLLASAIYLSLSFSGCCYQCHFASDAVSLESLESLLSVFPLIICSPLCRMASDSSRCLSSGEQSSSAEGLPGWTLGSRHISFLWGCPIPLEGSPFTPDNVGQRLRQNIPTAVRFIQWTLVVLTWKVVTTEGRPLLCLGLLFSSYSPLFWMWISCLFPLSSMLLGDCLTSITWIIMESLFFL